MNIRNVVIEALSQTVGLLDRTSLAPIALSGGDFALSELDIDSLSTYEIIMHIEDELHIEIAPDTVMLAKTLAELISAIDHIVHTKI